MSGRAVCDGRSAKELAKAWIKGDGIAALVRLLDTESQTAGLVIEQAVAEAQVAFDSYPGGKRNHDLLIKGRVAGGPIVIGLEAKADETVGETVEAYEAKATALLKDGRSTNASARLATSLTTVKRRQANKQALAEFVGAVTGAAVPTDDWWLVGPFHVPGERWSRIPLWIGHLTTPGEAA